MFSTRVENVVSFIKFEIVVCKLFQIGSPNLSFKEGLKRVNGVCGTAIPILKLSMND